VLTGDYGIIEADSSSFVMIDSYDTVSREIKGWFDLLFTAIHKPSSDAPDTIRITKGVFHGKVLNR
jgi:hypothetical protein